MSLHLPSTHRRLLAVSAAAAAAATMSVITATAASANPPSLESVATISTPFSPGQMLDDGSHLFVTGAGTAIYEYSTIDRSLVRTIAVGNGAASIAFDAGSLWALNSTDGTVSRINVTTGVVTATITVGAHPSTAVGNGTTLWVANGDNTLSAIDEATNTVTHTSTGVFGNPSRMVLAGGDLWIGDQANNAVDQVNPTTGALITRVGVPYDPITVVTNGAKVFTTGFGGWVETIDPSTAAISNLYFIGNAGLYGATAEPGGDVFVSDYNRAAMWELSGVDSSIVTNVNVGDGPRGIAVDANTIWVANGNAGTITEVNRDGYLPATPTGLTVDAVSTSGTALFSWHRAIDGGSAPLGVTVTSGDGHHHCTVGPLVERCAISGLPLGTTNFTVSATTTSGTSPASATVSAQVLAPGTQPTITFTAVSASKIRAYFLAPSITTGGAIDGYEYTLDGGYTWVSTPYMPSKTAFGLGGLTNGTTYGFAVRATSGANRSPMSSVVSLTPRTTAGAPAVSVVSSTATTAILSVGVPIVLGGGVLKHIQYSLDHAKTFATVSGLPATFTISKLHPGSTYQVIVRLITTAGASARATVTVATALHH